LKNVGPIFATASRRTPPVLILHCHSPGVATVARCKIDVHNNDNVWQRGPLWPQRMGPMKPPKKQIFGTFNTRHIAKCHTEMPDSSQDTLSMSIDDKYNSFIKTHELCTHTHTHATQQQPTRGDWSTQWQTQKDKQQCTIISKTLDNIMLISSASFNCMNPTNICSELNKIIHRTSDQDKFPHTYICRRDLIKIDLPAHYLSVEECKLNPHCRNYQSWLYTPRTRYNLLLYTHL